jgi:hypothetical protein
MSKSISYCNEESREVNMRTGYILLHDTTLPALQFTSGMLHSPLDLRARFWLSIEVRLSDLGRRKSEG